MFQLLSHKMNTTYLSYYLDPYDTHMDQKLLHFNPGMQDLLLFTTTVNTHTQNIKLNLHSVTQNYVQHYCTTTVTNSSM